MTQVIGISAGLPRAGVTTFAVAFALELARRNYRLALLDADWGGAGAGAALCLRPAFTLLDLAQGQANLDQVVDRHTLGIDYLPGGGPSRAFPQFEPESLQRLAQRLSQLPEYDYLILDIAAGIDKNRLALLEAADTLIVVGTPGDALLDETYDLIERLNQHGCAPRLWLLLNGCRNQTVGRHAYGRLRELTDFYLSLRLPLLGIVREVEQVPTHITSGLQPLFESSTLRADVARCADLISAGELGQASGSLPDFWRRFLKVADVPPVAISAEPVAPPPAAGQDVHDQLDQLAGHIESLIDQLERYSGRLATGNATDIAAHPIETEPVVESPRDVHYWLSDVAYESEGRSAGGCESFRIRQQSGGTVRCIWFTPTDAAAGSS